MASSFASQIETIVGLASMLLRSQGAACVLDIGKGFGKYGFLLHEYIGIDSTKRPDPSLTLAEQSRLVIDAVESNSDYLWPHICQIYKNVFVGRIEDVFSSLHGYDLVLMVDVIEHIDKQAGLDVVSHFVRDGAVVVIGTPTQFFQQALFESEDERHVSFWAPSDFRSLGYFVDHQTVGPGRVYLVSQRPLDLRGFGSKAIKRLRRTARFLRSEFFT